MLSKDCQYPCYSLSSVGVLVVIFFFLNYRFLCITGFHLPTGSAPQGTDEQLYWSKIKDLQHFSSCSFGQGAVWLHSPS